MVDIRANEPFFGAWYVDDFVQNMPEGDVYRLKQEENCFTHYSMLVHVQVAPSGSELYQLRSQGKSDEEITGIFEAKAKAIANRKGAQYDETYYKRSTQDLGYDVFFRIGDKVVMSDSDDKPMSLYDFMSADNSNKPVKKESTGGNSNNASKYILIAVLFLIVVGLIVLIVMNITSKAKDKTLANNNPGANGTDDINGVIEYEGNANGTIEFFTETETAANTEDMTQTPDVTTTPTIEPTQTQKPIIAIDTQWHDGTPTDAEKQAASQNGYEIIYGWKRAKYETKTANDQSELGYLLDEGYEVYDYIYGTEKEMLDGTYATEDEAMSAAGDIYGEMIIGVEQGEDGSWYAEYKNSEQWKLYKKTGKYEYVDGEKPSAERFSGSEATVEDSDIEPAWKYHKK